MTNPTTHYQTFDAWSHELQLSALLEWVDELLLENNAVKAQLAIAQQERDKWRRDFHAQLAQVNLLRGQLARANGKTGKANDD